MSQNIANSLVEKYNIAVPRYTSYPTVPFWKDALNMDDWKKIFSQQFTTHNSKEGISLYIHLPFCESLCTYCGCNKKITTHHNVEEEYMQAVIKEWRLYKTMMPEKPVIREIHLGGGTPTFFSPANLSLLLETICQDSIIHPQHEFSLEGHPNNTTATHLETLYRLGFRRVSYGVQDNDPEVQRIINRIQPLENVKKATDTARAIGFQSVNFDLIYGLPRQTLESMERTILQTLELKPDRIAFYSYAHVPWTSRGQRLFDENDLPSAQLKIQLYLLAKRLFIEHGYVDIGMDHFALPSDDLYIARQEGRLHRNFMGYTTQRTAMLIGLGVSSISDAGIAFAQNHKILQHYYDAIANNELAVTKGYFLNEEDVAFRKYILDVSCKGHTTFRKEDAMILKLLTFPELKKLERDGMLLWNKEEVSVTNLGLHFIRNICRCFDLHLLRNESLNEKPQYSKAI
jgi:oxygen-independent coproporphyrinogen III oxidase